MATLKKLYQGSPVTETTTTPGLYVAPAAGVLVKQLVISNSTAAPITLSLSHVTLAGTGGSANRVVSGMVCNPDSYGGPTIVDLFMPMTTGQFLTGTFSLAGAVLTVFGVEL